MAIEKALKVGVATITTRNHFHFGAAGIYSRMAIAHDCIGMALSSHRYRPRPDSTVLSASGGSPISIAVPSNEQPQLIVDMAAHFVRYDDETFERFPGAIFKGLGVAAVLQAMGGILAGIWNEGYTFTGEGKGAAPHQGAFVAVFDVKRFMDVNTFKQEMDRYIGEARATKPLPGLDRSELAGGMEWQLEKDHREIGIPLSDNHRERLEGVAADVGVDSPFAAFEDSQF
jgi:LDH2 family malate/lactate/ureidoglycolate dehydrogenase